MLASERLEKILDCINEKGSVEVKTLSEKFNVSEITIRRDLQKLEDRGLIHRTHGGARKNKPLALEVHYNEKKQLNHHIKEKIARKAIDFIDDDMTLLIDAGTTTFELAKAISEENLSNITIVTNDVNIAYHFYFLENFNIIFLGGLISKRVGNTQGVLTRESLKKLHCDLAFLGTSGISNDTLDLFTPSDEKVELKQLMIENSDEAILLVDKSKLGQNGLYTITNITSFDYVITDIEFSKEQLELIGHTTEVVKV